MKFVQPLDETWREDALCKGRDPAIFFPIIGEHEKVRAAKTICEDCPVRQECLDYALATRQRIGVWGGMSERERRRYRARQKVAAYA